MTAQATDVVSKLLAKNGSVAGVKVGFDGITYTVKYVKEEEIHALDERIEKDGAVVIVDWKAFGALVGKTLAFSEESGKFTIEDSRE
eukprot:CAMPEP_0167778170 /NCGR_PEP_ID=MMETSP0111_2-20121227/4105_1 /TAXON_ID=91324 /ORGANISM="Lotharella globosa, Strain CCCM811" /LENGTH=86 /DNA_ID=CAMNT_0007668445 /DNA_START=169 /DNA_END=429 /DNA_ORIENTATION=-